MERLILRQPPDEFPHRDEYGQRIVRPCEPNEDAEQDDKIVCVLVDDAASADFVARQTDRYTDWTVYARRTDRGGKQGIFADIMSGNWQTRFDLTRFNSLDTLNENWEITDVDGRSYDIESVTAGSQSGGRLIWQIYCIRRQTK